MQKQEKVKHLRLSKKTQRQGVGETRRAALLQSEVFGTEAANLFVEKKKGIFCLNTLPLGMEFPRSPLSPRHRLLSKLISSLCLGAVVSFATPAKADGSFPDISGTNVWNSTAPIFDRGGGGINPQLAERARRLNQEADQAYKACDAAVLAAQQGGTRGPRQFLRNPENTDAVFPVACQRLNELRQEAVNLRSQLEAAAKSGGSPVFRTW